MLNCKIFLFYKIFNFILHLGVGLRVFCFGHHLFIIWHFKWLFFLPSNLWESMLLRLKAGIHYTTFCPDLQSQGESTLGKIQSQSADF